MISIYPIPAPMFDTQAEQKRIYSERQECCHQYRLTRKTAINGAVTFREQCSICGRDGNSVKASELSDIQKKSAPNYAEGAHTTFWSALHKREADVLAARAEAANRLWWAWYNKYLSSDIWKARRALVINRAHGVCEACGTDKAAHVHHLTYEHVGREPLFDLRAVCAECHKIIDNK